MVNVVEQVCECIVCGNVMVGDICLICEDLVCVIGEICVVIDVVDFWVMECGCVFWGCYYVFGGSFLVLDEIGFDDLCILVLIDCIVDENIIEVIFVFLVIVDGQIIVYYIVEVLVFMYVSVIGFVQGVFIGGEFDYFDDGIISVVLCVC